MRYEILAQSSMLSSQPCSVLRSSTRTKDLQVVSEHGDASNTSAQFARKRTLVALSLQKVASRVRV